MRVYQLYSSQILVDELIHFKNSMRSHSVTQKVQHRRLGPELRKKTHHRCTHKKVYIILVEAHLFSDKHATFGKKLEAQI